MDDLWSLVGSANLDPRGLRLNFEFNLEIYDATTTGALARHFEESFARSRAVTMAVTMEEVDGRSLPERLRVAHAGRILEAALSRGTIRRVPR